MDTLFISVSCVSFRGAVRAGKRLILLIFILVLFLD